MKREKNNKDFQDFKKNFSQQKKNILWLIVTILMIGVIFLWFLSLKYNPILRTLENSEINKNQGWQKIKNEWENFFQKLKKEEFEIKSSLNKEGSNSTSTPLNSNDLEKLKDTILKEAEKKQQEQK